MAVERDVVSDCRHVVIGFHSSCKIMLDRTYIILVLLLNCK